MITKNYIHNVKRSVQKIRKAFIHIHQLSVSVMHLRFFLSFILLLSTTANAIEFIDDEYLSCSLTTTSLKYTNLISSSYTNNTVTTPFNFTGQIYYDASSLETGIKSTLLSSYQSSISSDVVITYQNVRYYAGNTNTSGKIHFTYNVSSTNGNYPETLHYHYVFFTYECSNNICSDGFPSDLLGYTGCDRPSIQQCSDNSYALQTDNCPVAYTNQDCNSEFSCLEWSRIQGNCNLETDTYSFNYTDPDNLSFSCTTVATNPDSDPAPDPNNNPTLSYVSVISDSAITQAIDLLRQQVESSSNSNAQSIEDRMVTNTAQLQFSIEGQTTSLLNTLGLNQADADRNRNQNTDRIVTAINAIDTGNNNSISIDTTSLETKADTTNQLLVDLNNKLTVTTPTNTPTEFSDSQAELDSKRLEFSQYLTTQKNRVTALFNINNISFSGSMPDVSFQILNTTFTVDTTWVDYILTFLGVLVVLWAYYDALIIVLGG